MAADAGIEERVRAALVRGLAWTVSESNNEALWVRVRDTASNLLISFWRDGELVGARAEEAFSGSRRLHQRSSSSLSMSCWPKRNQPGYS